MRIDAAGNELRQVSVWLPVPLIELMRADGLNVSKFIRDQIDILYGDPDVPRNDRARLAIAARESIARQRAAEADREADRERARAAIRAMRADRDAAQVRQEEIAAALAAIVGKRAGQYRRVLPENDPYGDNINEWDALVAGVSRRCGAAVDPAEVAAALRGLGAAKA